MTKEEINQTIAEECGWLMTPDEKPGYSYKIGGTNRWVYPISISDDLNAMHEAEKTLTGKEWNDYIRRLGTCQTLQDNPYIGDLWASNVVNYNLCRATSQQRAEAFLCTKGKWRGA